MNLTERYQEKLHQQYGNLQLSLDGILLQLEVTNACNHRCLFCPNSDSSRKRCMMDYDLAVRVIKECASFLGKDKRICFHMNGEPLLYPRLVELVRLAKSLHYDYIFLTTNGSLADEATLKALLDAGLDSIKFSINAGTPETYKLIHGHNDFQKALDGLRYVSQYRANTGRNIKIFVSCVVVRQNQEELLQLQSLTEPYCDEVVFYQPCSYAGQAINIEDMQPDLSTLPVKCFEITHDIPCAVLWNSINVTCEGYLALCCSEADHRLIVEDVNHASVQECWMGEKMMRIRQKHLEKNICDTPCHACVTNTPYHAEAMDCQLFALALEKSHYGN